MPTLVLSHAHPAVHTIYSACCVYITRSTNARHQLQKSTLITADGRMMNRFVSPGSRSSSSSRGTTVRGGGADLQQDIFMVGNATRRSSSLRRFQHQGRSNNRRSSVSSSRHQNEQRHYRSWKVFFFFSFLFWCRIPLYEVVRGCWTVTLLTTDFDVTYWSDPHLCWSWPRSQHLR